MTRMELNIDDQAVEHIISAKYPGRRHPSMLVLMPTEMIADPWFIGQTQAGTITSPQSKPPPSTGLEMTVIKLDGMAEQIPEKQRPDLLSGLDQGTLGDTVQRKSLEKLKKLYKQAFFKSETTRQAVRSKVRLRLRVKWRVGS